MSHPVKGLWTYAEFGVFTALFLPAMGIAHLIHKGDPTQRVPGQWMRRFGRTSSRFTPLWKFHVEGEAPKDILYKPYVVVANHESTADPFLLCSLPFDMRWIAKEELFKLPVLGWMMKFGGDIPLRRGERDSVKQMMDEAKRTLAAGMPIMIFPEGTRSADGALLPFKDGAFQLAIEAGVPVLPLAIAGTRNCRPKGSKWFGEANAIVKVLEPIDSKGVDVATLRERARTRIGAEVEDLRRRLGYVTTAPVSEASTTTEGSATTSA
jgi:1-acyl-sn-glycerol-3-phosphate acyltransferase